MWEDYWEGGGEGKGYVAHPLQNYWVGGERLAPWPPSSNTYALVSIAAG